MAEGHVSGIYQLTYDTGQTTDEMVWDKDLGLVPTGKKIKVTMTTQVHLTSDEVVEAKKIFVQEAKTQKLMRLALLQED